jgi:3'-phosphoadenosine 5'-phosphosulfate sulfotransferase (PAPS reductase)/FAD synthetase
MMQEKIRELIDRGALFVVNHSGGKDSQAMFAYVSSLVPASQIVVVHAELPEVDWEGVVDHVKATIGAAPLYLCRSRRTLLEMVEERGMFPSPTLRQCTSDLKRGPIERTIRGISKERGVGLIVNCMGLRAEESSSRAKAVAFKFSERNSKAGREWYDWLPIHDWPVSRVWQEIADAGQEPHWAYKKGMSRLSCCFCIMASKADLTRAAELNPVLYKRYVDLENKIGQVMLMPTKRDGRRSLEQVTGIKAA